MNIRTESSLQSCSDNKLCIPEVRALSSGSLYPCSVTGHRVLDLEPQLPESLSGCEMVEVIEAKPLIAISL